MGRIRALAAKAHPETEVVQVVDLAAERAGALATEIGCAADTDWEKLVARDDVDAIVVSTVHSSLASIALAALGAGKHVFCEKPMARNAGEAGALAEAAVGAEKTGRAVVVGFTLRHHPAIARLHELVEDGAIGQLFYIRASYGHGGRPGYDREWRVDPAVSGGGELLDQGVHLIDLSRWLLGDFVSAYGRIGTYYWTGNSSRDVPINRDFATSEKSVEDNGFMLLSTSIGQTAMLHASWTQWKNKFEFEVYGRDGSLSVTGLGGSYGPEKLIHARRRPEGGAPELIEESFDDTSDVWQREWNAFVASATGTGGAGLSTPATAADAFEVLRILEKVYESARGDSPVRGYAAARRP